MASTVTIATHTRIYTDRSVSVTGGVLTSYDDASAISDGDTVYVYYDDPNRQGGAVTLKATKVLANAVNSASHLGRHFVGQVTVPTTGSIGGAVANPVGVQGAIWNSNIVGTPANLTGLSGSEAINNAYLPSGSNHIVNSEFTQVSGTYPIGFSGAWSGNSSVITGATDSVIATVGGAKAIQRVATFSSSPSGYQFDGLQVLDSTLYGIPVTPGQNIMASCAVASQNTAGVAYLCITWLDANGAYVAENDGGNISCNINGATTDIASWPRTQWSAVVPADGTFTSKVRYAVINTRFNTGTATTQTVWSARPMLSIVPTGQTVYPAYQVGPVSRLADQTSLNTAANSNAIGGLTPAQVANSNITIGSNGALNGAGGGAVTIGGLGYTGALNATYGAEWGSNVTGTPANIAALTGSEAINNALVPTGNGNMVVFSQMEKGTTGWSSAYNTPTASVLSTFTASQVTYCEASATATAASQSFNIYNGIYQCPVTAGKSYAASAIIGLGNGQPATANLTVNWYNGSGTYISASPVGSSVAATGGGVYESGIVTAPSGAIYCFIVASAVSTGAGAIQVFMGQPMITPATTGQAVVPAFSPGPNAVPGADITANNTAANSNAVGGLTPAQVANSNITLGANGALSGGGGGAVTIGGLGYTGDLNATHGAIWNSNIVGTPANLTGLTGSEAINNAVLQTALTTGTVKPAESTTITSQSPWATTTLVTPANVITPNPNMIYNPTGRLGLQGWTQLGATAIGYNQGGNEGYFFQCVGGTNTGGVLQYQDVPVYANASFSLSAMIFAGNLSGTGAYARVYIDWQTSSHTHISYSSTACQVPAGNGWTYVACPNQIAPSNAAFARVCVDINGPGTWTNTNTAWKLIKLEGGAACTPYQDNATYGAAYQGGTLIDSLKPAQAGADVTSQNTAAFINLQGALATQNTVNAGQIAVGAVSTTYSASSSTTTNGVGGSSYNLLNLTITPTATTDKFQITLSITGSSTFTNPISGTSQSGVIFVSVTNGTGDTFSFANMISQTGVYQETLTGLSSATTLTLKIQISGNSTNTSGQVTACSLNVVQTRA